MPAGFVELLGLIRVIEAFEAHAAATHDDHQRFLGRGAPVRDKPELSFAAFELHDFGLDAGDLFFESGDFFADFGVLVRQRRHFLGVILDAGLHRGDAEQFVPLFQRGFAGGQLFRQSGLFAFFLRQLGAQARNVRFQFVW